MSDDSADKRAVGAHPESFSGRAHPRTRRASYSTPVLFDDKVKVDAVYGISEEPMSAEEWKKQYVKEG